LQKKVAEAKNENGGQISSEQEETIRKEKKVFAFDELNNDKYKIHQIDFQDFSTGTPKPRLLLVHGFGATGSVYYSVVKDLRKYFRVTTIDLLGLGASGRPPTFLPTDAH